MQRLFQATALFGSFAVASLSYGSSIGNVSISGPYDVWEETAGILRNIGEATAPPPLADYLQGTASAPGSNIELNNDGSFSVSTTLTGALDGLTVEVRSPTQANWQADGYALAFDYVNDALASIGKSSADWVTSLCGPFDLAVKAFVDGPPGPPTAAQRISDPNVEYISLNGPQLSIGLAGQLDAGTAGIGPLLPCVGLSPGTPTAASEVMALSVKRGSDVIVDDEYKYSFDVTPSGQGTEGCFETDDRQGVCSYDGTYEITVPVRVPPPAPVPAISPLGLLLLSGILVAVGAWRARRKGSS